MRSRGRDVVDIEDGVWEVFVEDARLNEVGDLRSDERSLGVTAGAEGFGGQPEGHHEGEHNAEHSEEADGNKDAAAADTQRGESNDFGVHRHAAETEEDADQDGHRYREDQNTGDDAKKKRDDLGAGTCVTDEDLHQANKFGHEKNEGEDDQTKKSVT